MSPSAFAVFMLMTSSNLVGCCDRKIGWVGAAQDLVDKHRGALEIVADYRAIGEETACVDIFA